MLEKEIYINDILRCPTGKKNGAYKSVLIEEVCAQLIDNLLLRNELNSLSTELILGNSIGTMGNMARYAAQMSKLPDEVSATTIDFQCGGAYKAIELAAGLIKSGLRASALVGGIESNSLKPTRAYHINDPRKGKSETLEVAEFSPNAQISLAQSAENLGKKYGFQKNELTKWAYQSHQKASSFSSTLLYNYHVIANQYLGIDQTIKTYQTYDEFEKLGNQSLYLDHTNTAHFHDAAGICLLSTLKTERSLAKILAIKIIGIDADNSPFGAVQAFEELMKDSHLQLSDIDIFEVNESFAIKPLVFSKHFNIPLDKINILGGNLAYGHPFAASGIINLLNLICALKITNQKYGVVTAGIAGGYGAAILIESLTE